MEDINKQILEKISNLENYIEYFVNTREHQLIDKVNGAIGMIDYYKKHSDSFEQRNNELQKRNDELFNEVCNLSKEVVKLNEEIAKLKINS